MGIRVFSTAEVIDFCNGRLAQLTDGFDVGPEDLVEGNCAEHTHRAPC